MRRLTDFLYEKASPKAIIATAVLTAVVVITNFTLYFTKFLTITGGTAYMELNTGYLPADLFAFAESYGEAGRRMYIAMSATLDLLTPFFGALLMAWIALCFAKKKGDTHLCSGTVLCAAAMCLSDWAENVCMITILANYPARITAAAYLARIFTALKYVLMIVLLVLLVLNIKGKMHTDSLA